MGLAEHAHVRARRGGEVRSGGGFTLTELLVVLGVIVLLISMLLPALVKARRQAEVTKCVAQLRAIGTAFTAYTGDNDGELPMASMTNSDDSPYSPHGLETWKQPQFHPWIGKPIQEDDSPARPGDIVNPPPALAWSGNVVAPIGWLFLRETIGGSTLWRCPSQTRSSGGGFRTEDYVMTSEVKDDGDGLGAYFDWGRGSVWKPGYMYMATHEYQYFINAHPDIAAKYRMRDWIIRNVAGLQLARVRPVRGGATESVVTFTDYSVLYHSRTAKDVYELGPGARGIYRANFLFLDGHVETRAFYDFGSYIAQFHRGIRQGWHGKDYAEDYAAEMGKEWGPAGE